MCCCVDDCAKFLIDLGLELVILYEHIYEIYGDIQGATNSFKIQAYEQGRDCSGGNVVKGQMGISILLFSKYSGGICVGRVTNACLTLE